MTFTYIALAATAVVWTLVLMFASDRSVLRSRASSLFPLLTFAVLTVVFAVRANAGQLDRIVYTIELREIAGHSLNEAFGLTLRTKQEPMYMVFMWLVSERGQSTAWLYVCVGAACAAIYLAGLLKLVPAWQASLIWLTTLALGFFTAYASQVARQGLSMAMLVAAVCLILRGSRTLWWALMLTGTTLFHWSAIPAVVAVALVTVAHVRLRVVVAVWGAASIAFLTGAQTRVLGPIAARVPGLNEYTNGALARVYTGGVNRLDFYLFSLTVLAVGLTAAWRGPPTPWYPKLVAMYAVLNIYFLMFGFISYSDRLAAYSWSLAPLVLAVPFANPRTTAGRARTAVFLLAVLAFGFVIGPFSQMTGFEPYQ